MFLGVWCWSQSLSLENLACAARSDSRDTSFVHFWPLRDGMPTRLEAPRCACDVYGFRMKERVVSECTGVHVHVHVHAHVCACVSLLAALPFAGILLLLL